MKIGSGSSRFLILALLVSVAVLAATAVPGLAGTATRTVVVTPADLETETNLFIAATNHSGKWFFYNDETDVIDNTLGSFVAGPGSPALGVGSVQITVSGTQRRNLATYQFSGTKLADITELKFSTYNPSAGSAYPMGTGYLNFNVDFNGSDTWQRRLVFVPPAASITQNQWKEWDAIGNGNALWHYSGRTWPTTSGGTSGVPGSTLKTWNQILSDYPGVRIRVSDSWLGIRVGSPYPLGYTENIDAFKFGTASGTTVFDFEPGAEFCKKDGWKTSATPKFKNQGDCVSHIATGGKN